MVHQFHEKEILLVKQENEELRLYKELVDKSLTDQELKQEYIALRHRLADAEKELNGESTSVDKKALEAEAAKKDATKASDKYNNADQDKKDAYDKA
ncbi:MAG: hypothetical protein E7K67_09915, partial [Peptostreptococcaceae bacterium]|nr:hypothetical protein [Peptostreptococcaceae bacterium]